MNKAMKMLCDVAKFSREHKRYMEDLLMRYTYLETLQEEIKDEKFIIEELMGCNAPDEDVLENEYEYK